MPRKGDGCQGHLHIATERTAPGCAEPYTKKATQAAHHLSCGTGIGG